MTSSAANRGVVCQSQSRSHALSQWCKDPPSGATLQPLPNIKLGLFLRQPPTHRKVIMGHKKTKRKGAASGLHYPKEAVTYKNKVRISYDTQNLLTSNTSYRAPSSNRLAISTKTALRAISPQRTSSSRTRRRRNSTSLSAPSRSPRRSSHLSRVRRNLPHSTSLSASSRPPSPRRSLCSPRMRRSSPRSTSPFAPSRRGSLPSKRYGSHLSSCPSRKQPRSHFRRASAQKTLSAHAVACSSTRRTSLRLMGRRSAA